MNKYSKKRYVTCMKGTAVISLLFLTLPIKANEKYLQLVEQLQLCQKIKVPNERTKCYDQLTSHISTKNIQSLEPLVKKSDTTLKEVKASSPTKEQLKASLGSEYLKESDKPDETGPHQFILTNARKDKLGYWRFYFKNGQVWRQSEKKRVKKIENFPVNSILTSGMFGSYRLKIGTERRSVKVKRLK